ncbi:Acetylesterase [Penicillium verhagenii]|uniref:Acetylesterase n=1 Tax=Penicillium verhagenii TaxID=1562060 RepID=UPI0025452FCD|nr:Acetylesterase [Penicillium verhagenii]KAJ5924097.1 Acetylesterase [Penicillium verhagenii]
MKGRLLWWATSLTMAAAAPFGKASLPTYFFTFGDSYSMTSFNVYGEQATPQDPMGNPPLGTGTTGGGINWIGDLTTADNDSLVLSYNLAVGGATIDNNIINAGVEDMATQVATFLSIYGDKPGIAPWSSDNTVFGFWIGINDVGWSYAIENATTLVPELMAVYKSLAEQIYAKGGRKFLFLNVPPTSRSPYILDQGIAASRAHAAWLAVYNEYLKLMVLGFQDEHPEVGWDFGVKIIGQGLWNAWASLTSNDFQIQTVIYNSWEFMTGILDDPHKYGYPNNTCIDDDGTTCVWWNNYHPGLKYHALQSKDMKKYLSPFKAW